MKIHNPAFFMFATLALASLSAQEKATLDKPVQRTTADYEIGEVRLQRLPTWELVIVYYDNLGVRHNFYRAGVFEAATPDDPATKTVDESRPGNPKGADRLIRQLNRADLSTKSLERRALELLVSEGEIPGATVTGKPRGN